MYVCTHPQLVSRSRSPTWREAMPKSATFMFLFSSNSKFSGFRSRWLDTHTHTHTHTFTQWYIHLKGYAPINDDLSYHIILSQLNIPYFMLVAKIHSRNNLPEEAPCLSFWEPPLSNEIIKQLASWNVLQHKVSADNRSNMIVSTMLERLCWRC